uniref:Uncharacterized protein n=1 Tax=Sphaerodactylus townsendi TaxID=933632 RepID=A0ACB8FJH4_9SAUR
MGKAEDTSLQLLRAFNATKCKKRFVQGADDQDRVYEALWLHTSEVTREWEQLKADFSALQSQRAYLMAEHRDTQALVTRVGSYMEIHGNGFRSDREKVFEVGTQLRRETVIWIVGLVEEDAPEIYSLEQFLLTLQQRFEDPLGESLSNSEASGDPDNCELAGNATNLA